MCSANTYTSKLFACLQQFLSYKEQLYLAEACYYTVKDSTIEVNRRANLLADALYVFAHLQQETKTVRWIRVDFLAAHGITA